MFIFVFLFLYSVSPCEAVQTKNTEEIVETPSTPSKNINETTYEDIIKKLEQAKNRLVVKKKSSRYALLDKKNDDIYHYLVNPGHIKPILIFDAKEKAFGLLDLLAELRETKGYKDLNFVERQELTKLVHKNDSHINSVFFTGIREIEIQNMASYYCVPDLSSLTGLKRVVFKNARFLSFPLLPKTLERVVFIDADFRNLGDDYVSYLCPEKGYTRSVQDKNNKKLFQSLREDSSNNFQNKGRISIEIPIQKK